MPQCRDAGHVVAVAQTLHHLEHTTKLPCAPPVCVSSVTLQVSLESRGPESFKTPRGVCVPFGSMELALASRPAAEQQRFASLLAASEPAGLAQLEDIAEEMQVGPGSSTYSTSYCYAHSYLIVEGNQICPHAASVSRTRLQFDSSPIG